MQSPSIDTHTHTIYCGHAQPTMTVAASVAAAEELGLIALAITEHLHSPDHLARIERIREDLAALSPRCRVYLGAEVDADPHAADGSLIAPVDGLAYVIASTHHYPLSGEWWYDDPRLDSRGKANTIDAWFAWAEQIVANPAVDTFAHPGVLLAQKGLTTRYSGAILDGFRRVFAAAAAHDTRIELNELASKKLTDAHRASYPDLIRAALEAGCRIVLATDAHRPEAVGQFDWTLQVADQAGLTADGLALPPWRHEPDGGA